jgi:hypothetical protein
MTDETSRDIEFDLENDRERCLHGLGCDETYDPSDVQRVTEIFKNPQFFIDGADSNDLVQGGIGDCWFISALATMSTYGGLVERFCVAVSNEFIIFGQRVDPYSILRGTNKLAFTASYSSGTAVGSLSLLTSAFQAAVVFLRQELIDLVQHAVHFDSEVRRA